jgi:hypothetical protein
MPRAWKRRDDPGLYPKSVIDGEVVSSMSERHKKKFTAWLATVAFLAIQTIAFAHEIKHDLHQHDASCALHVYVEQVGKVPTGDIAFVAVVLPDAVLIALDVAIALASPAPLYRTRAPPSSSTIV